MSNIRQYTFVINKKPKKIKKVKMKDGDVTPALQYKRKLYIGYTTWWWNYSNTREFSSIEKAVEEAKKFYCGFKVLECVTKNKKNKIIIYMTWDMDDYEMVKPRKKD